MTLPARTRLDTAEYVLRVTTGHCSGGTSVGSDRSLGALQGAGEKYGTERSGASRETRWVTDRCPRARKGAVGGVAVVSATGPAPGEYGRDLSHLAPVETGCLRGACVADLQPSGASSWGRRSHDQTEVSALLRGPTQLSDRAWRCGAVGGRMVVVSARCVSIGVTNVGGSVVEKGGHSVSWNQRQRVGE